MSLEIIKQLNVDFHDSRYIQVNAKQYDRLSRFILVTCCNQGKVFPLDKTFNYAYICYKKPDDLGVFNSCEITDDGKIFVELSEQMLAVAGKCYADLIIVHNESESNIDVAIEDGNLIVDKNSSIVSTMKFCVNVIENAIDHTEIESTHEYNALNDLLIKATDDYTYVMNAFKESEEQVKQSEANAKQSELNAQTYAENVQSYTNQAVNAAADAQASAESANNSEINAQTYANNALASLNETKDITENVREYESEVKTHADNADAFATLSKSYAVGGTDTRDDEDIDNSKYYYTQAKAINDKLGGMFAPQGTIEFSELQSVEKHSGYVYHIKYSFVTDETFKDGGGVSYPAGTNVYCTYDGYWDCFVGELLTITDDGNGNVKIDGTYDFVTTYDEFTELNQLVAQLQARIKLLEDQPVLGVTE